jgi:hypothetical protein
LALRLADGHCLKNTPLPSGVTPSSGNTGASPHAVPRVRMETMKSVVSMVKRTLRGCYGTPAGLATAETLAPAASHRGA